MIDGFMLYLVQQDWTCNVWALPTTQGVISVIEELMRCLVQQGWPCNACPPPTTLQDSQCFSQVDCHSIFHTKNKAPPRKK
jgi:hypothetical protein